MSVIPININPVEKDPSRKYFNDASLLFKFFLSLPVKIYNGIDMISIPRNRISNELKDDEIMIPQTKKKMNVQPIAIVLKKSASLSNFIIPVISILNK